YNPMQAPELPKQWFIGPSVGYSVNMAGGGFHSLTANPDCGGFTGGSGSGIAAGIAAEYLFKQEMDVSSGIMFRFDFEQKPGSFTTTYGPVMYYNSVTQKPEEVAENHIADITYNVLNARLLYMYSVPHTKIGVELGPSIGIVSKLNVHQHLQINTDVSPGVTFGNGGTDSTIYDNTPDSKSGIRFGLWAGADYRLDVGEWMITPYLCYDLGLTKALSTDSWSVSSIIVGVDFKYGLR
ncbi:MAG: hypothetical protein ACREOZ_00575, partial [Gloeomargaritales cyanobacterium]